MSPEISREWKCLSSKHFTLGINKSLLLLFKKRFGLVREAVLYHPVLIFGCCPDLFLLKQYLQQQRSYNLRPSLKSEPEKKAPEPLFRGCSLIVTCNSLLQI